MKRNKSFLLAACAMAAMCEENLFAASDYAFKARKTVTNGKAIKPQFKQLHEFKIKGHTIMAYSRKDAIKKLKAKGLL